MTGRASFTCTSVAATQQLAASLAGLARPGDVVVLVGDLGAGKTTFTQGYARALGVAEDVTSPTYTLVHHYRCDGPGVVTSLVHADLWRLAGASELADLALDEALADGAVAIVEWGERFGATDGLDRVVVTFETPSATTRTITVDLSDSSLPPDAVDELHP